MSKYGEPEIYSRYLRADWIKENNTRIHSNAFLPLKNPTTSREEVSCYETQNLSIDDIQSLSIENQISPNRKKSVGHCSIHENRFLRDKLSIDKNYIPQRHIDIIGWDIYPSKEDKKEIASQLAEISSENIIIY